MAHITLALIVLLFASGAQSTEVEWVEVDGAIGPVAHKVISEALERAEQSRVEALVIALDTPGGLLQTTRMICKDILAAKVPVVVYVSPSGARAGSAGVFLTLASHVAAMAPGTNIGAAHPVGIGGQQNADTSTVMEGKITNDAAAFARTLAEQRHRNVEWAERAVRESISATDREALEAGVIDLICSSRDSILLALDGRVVVLNGQSHTLRTAGATVHEVPMSWRLKILSLIADPNIAYILLMLGIYGLFFELYNPGVVLPGVVGGLSLILALFSLQLLPFTCAGLLLIGLGILLFALEVKIASYGLLSVGGIIALLLGSFMLFDPVDTGIRVDWTLIIPFTLVTAAFFLFVVGAGLRAQRRKVVTGQEGLVGESGTIISTIGGGLKIQVHGELWEAQSSKVIQVGQRARVVAVKGMRLTIEPE